MARRRSIKPSTDAQVVIFEQPEEEEGCEETETFEIFSENDLAPMIQEMVEMESSIPPEEYIVELIPPPVPVAEKKPAPELKPKPVRSKPPRNIPRFSRMA
jgi:hypothetical protein